MSGSERMPEKPLTFRDLMAAQPCDYCGAEPNVPCVSKSGRRRSDMHSARFYEAQAVRRGER